MSRKEVGTAGEDAAVQFLIQKGFKILARNYRKPWGEIDIIALKNNCVRFVEVKTVSIAGSVTPLSISNYLPEEQVHEKKLKKIVRTAELYMDTVRDKREFQIDVVGVVIHADSRTAHCRLFEQAL